MYILTNAARFRNEKRNEGKAIDLSPVCARLHDKLGDIYDKFGQSSAAQTEKANARELEEMANEATVQGTK